MPQIKAAWSKFRKQFIYRALIAGKWQVIENVEEGKRLGALKIDIKKAKDVCDFPDYLEAIQ